MDKWGPGWLERNALGVGKWLVQDVAMEFWEETLEGGARLIAGDRGALAARIGIEGLKRHTDVRAAYGQALSAYTIAAPVLFLAGYYAGILESVEYSVEADMHGEGSWVEPFPYW
jgi:hypothetical protein